LVQCREQKQYNDICPTLKYPERGRGGRQLKAGRGRARREKWYQFYRIK
jgi:hypothetical protein